MSVVSVLKGKDDTPSLTVIRHYDSSVNGSIPASTSSTSRKSGETLPVHPTSQEKEIESQKIEKPQNSHILHDLIVHTENSYRKLFTYRFV